MNFIPITGVLFICLVTFFNSTSSNQICTRNARFQTLTNKTLTLLRSTEIIPVVKAPIGCTSKTCIVYCVNICQEHNCTVVAYSKENNTCFIHNYNTSGTIAMKQDMDIVLVLEGLTIGQGK